MLFSNFYKDSISKSHTHFLVYKHCLQSKGEESCDRHCLYVCVFGMELAHFLREEIHTSQQTIPILLAMSPGHLTIPFPHLSPQKTSLTVWQKKRIFGWSSIFHTVTVSVWILFFIVLVVSVFLFMSALQCSILARKMKFPSCRIIMIIIMVPFSCFTDYV